MGVSINNNKSFELPQFGTIRPNGDFKTEFLDYQLDYHSSWDWFMPILKRIDDLEYELPEDSNLIGDITEGLVSIDLTMTYIAACNFIEWYNENKKP